jgi:hypothetical protein
MLSRVFLPADGTGSLLYTVMSLDKCSGNGVDPEAVPKPTLEIYGPLGLRKFITTALGISRSPLVYK